jgi:hypothetical protein
MSAIAKCSGGAPIVLRPNQQLKLLSQLGYLLSQPRILMRKGVLLGQSFPRLVFARGVCRQDVHVVGSHLHAVRRFGDRKLAGARQHSGQRTYRSWIEVLQNDEGHPRFRRQRCQNAGERLETSRRTSMPAMGNNSFFGCGLPGLEAAVFSLIASSS